jgi:hypothetical protein
VVEVTVNGAVPMAMFETNLLAVVTPDMSSVPVTLTPVPLMIRTLAVPALDILTLALATIVTFELPLTNDPAVATFKFATCVVEVTVNGAVPIAMFDTSVLAVTAPLTPNDVSVPTLVMFGCAAVVTVSDIPAAATFRFATCVVEFTTNGAVPMAMFE